MNFLSTLSFVYDREEIEDDQKSKLESVKGRLYSSDGFSEDTDHRLYCSDEHIEKADLEDVAIDPPRQHVIPLDQPTSQQVTYGRFARSSAALDIDDLSVDLENAEVYIDNNGWPTKRGPSVEIDAGSPRSMSTAKTERTSSSSGSASKKPTYKVEPATRCIRWFGHGKLPTMMALAMAWGGVVLSIFARQSVQFSQLETGIYIAPIYEPVTAIGLVNMEMCYNETLTTRTGCERIMLSPDEVNDVKYELARLFGASSVVFGAFFAFFLTLSICWETIDLRPIGFGLLITYFFQSFTMIFFDAEICKTHKCTVGPGCFMCIGASCCWVLACLATAKMEAFKIRATRRRRRRNKRRAKQALADAQKLAAAKPFKRKESTVTEKTSSSASSEASSLEIFLEEENQLGFVQLPVRRR